MIDMHGEVFVVGNDVEKPARIYCCLGIRISSCLLGQPLNLVVFPLPRVRLTGAADGMNDGRPAPDPGKAPAVFAFS